MKYLFTLIALLGIQFVEAQQTPAISSIPKQLFWENSPARWSFQQQVLAVQAGAKTDMFRDPNVTYNTDNAPKLLFQPDSNFILTAAVEHAFMNKWDGGALVLKVDSLRWIKFCLEKDYTGAKRIVSVVTNNVSDDANSIAITGNKAFFKMAKAGNVITLYVSTDGKKWLLVRHVQMNIPEKFSVGFLAQSPTGQSCTVRFSNIQYAAKKLKDPYVAE
jgi:regulation of enolase protein 1 (concanavalin A-like superfamily)